VFGANDQVTAETVSKGLGKRTVRYKTESRTIELMGLHRRTKVEQLRERDLMMPQEVRQMPTDKMVILAEGQNPIFADKLRFFRTAPFKAMEWFSRANMPDVPATEFLPQRPVPAIASGHAPATTLGGQDAEVPRPVLQSAPTNQMGKTGPHETHRLKVLEPKPDPVAAALGRLSPNVRAHAKVSAAMPEVEATSVVKVTPDAKPRKSDAETARQLPLFKEEIDTRFDIAARRLRSLIGGKGRELPRPQSPRDWSAIFDETVADDASILELETN